MHAILHVILPFRKQILCGKTGWPTTRQLRRPSMFGLQEISMEAPQNVLTSFQFFGTNPLLAFIEDLRNDFYDLRHHVAALPGEKYLLLPGVPFSGRPRNQSELFQARHQPRHRRLVFEKLLRKHVLRLAVAVPHVDNNGELLGSYREPAIGEFLIDSPQHGARGVTG